MHVIIGKGNLGIDLKAAATIRDQRAIIYTRSSGFDWFACRDEILDLNPTHIWVTAGFGSVDQCEANLMGAFEAHVNLPLMIARTIPDKISLGLFSTDYAAHPSDPGNPAERTPHPRSLYALTKIWMEDSMMWLSRPYTSIFRVSSLYGEYFPHKTFPGKVAEFKPSELPTNVVVPTPTWWIASKLMDSLKDAFSPKGAALHHVAPLGPGVKTSDWGRMVLGDKYVVRDRPADQKRPMISNLGCTLPGAHPTWQALWELHLRHSGAGVPGDSEAAPPA